MSKIPSSVIKAAKPYTEQYKASVYYMGKYKGSNAYGVRFSEDLCIGLPPVFLEKEGRVTDVTGKRASFDAIDLLVTENV